MSSTPHFPVYMDYSATTPVDPRVVDKWGIPVPRFHFKWSDYEIKQAKLMQETFR